MENDNNMRLDPAAFTEIVTRDIRGQASAAEVKMLEENVREWIAELNSLLRDIEIQFSSRKAELSGKQADLLEQGDQIVWLRFKSQDEHWRVKANRFKASIEKRLHYAKALRARLGHHTKTNAAD
jgi:hypothetical protein